LSEQRRPWSRVLLRDREPDLADNADPRVEERLLLRAALRKLPERQRTVLVLRFLCDLPVLEVAGLLGLAEGTVKAHTARGLEALRRQMGTSAAPSSRSVA